MKRFQWLKKTNKMCLVYLECELQEDRCGKCSYKLKCKKRAEITYLQGKKQQRRHRLTYLQVSMLEQRYGSWFEGQSTTPKVYGAFSAVKNKQLLLLLLLLLIYFKLTKP